VPRKIQQQGFSLVELMVLVCVMALALGLGIPAFTTMFANNRMSAVVNDVVSGLHTARSAAITRQATVTLCPAPDGAGDCGGSLADGWVVFVDADGDAGIDADEEIIASHGALPPASRDGISALPADAPGYISFSASGRRGAPGLDESITDLQFCDDRGDVDTGGGIAAGRWIRISETGHPEIQRTRAALQESSPLGGC
jgi:Tfp pilus assembly protein FimT